jgi:hypothetical protein
MATYPGGIKSFSTKTDNVSEVMSSDVNEPQDEITAIETELGVDVAGTATDLVTRLARSLSGTGNLDFATSTALTIATGSITISQNWHTVDTESAAASDELDTIVATIATDGFMLFMRQANNARDVTIKHNTGNIYCPGGVDIALTDTTQVVAFIYDATLTKWLAAVCPANAGLLNGANTWSAANIFSKALNFAYTSVTADTTLDATHFFVDVDCTSDAVDITLPTVVGINGREYIIRKLDASANVVNIIPDGTETINGSSDAILDERYETAIIFSNGSTDWMLLATGGGGGSSSDLIEHTHTGSTDGGLLRLDTIAAPTDTTTRNSSTDAHGLLPKLDGISTNFLNGQGGWSAPAGGSTDLAEHTHSDSDTGGLIRLDTIAAPTDSTSLDASTDLHGLLPKLDGSSDNFLTGTGAWLKPRLDLLDTPADTTSLNASTDAHGLLPKLSGTSDQYINGIGEWATVTVAASTDFIEHNHSDSDTGGLIRLDTISAPTDSTSLDASTDAHGLLPKLSGITTEYLNGSGAYQALASNSGNLANAIGVTAGIVLLIPSSDFTIGTTDVSSAWRVISQDNFNALMRSATTDFDASTDTHGFLPMLSGTSDNFLNGKGEYAAIQTATTDTAGIKMLASSSDLNAGTTDNLMLGTNLFTKSNYGIRFVYAPLNGSTALAAGDKTYFPIPAEMSGWNLVQARATCGANTSTDATVFTVKKGGGTQTMLSTNITIDPTLLDSLGSSDQPVISSSDNPVTSTDIIECSATSDCGAGMTYAGILTGWQLP